MKYLSRLFLATVVLLAINRIINANEDPYVTIYSWHDDDEKSLNAYEIEHIRQYDYFINTCTYEYYPNGRQIESIDTTKNQ
jgi:hypothetical protein